MLGSAGEAFKRYYKVITGRDCGCSDRQAALNQRFPLSLVSNQPPAKTTP
jgi:hypothetical protein